MSEELPKFQSGTAAQKTWATDIRDKFVTNNSELAKIVTTVRIDPVWWIYNNKMIIEQPVDAIMATARLIRSKGSVAETVEYFTRWSRTNANRGKRNPGNSRAMVLTEGVEKS